MPGALIVDAAEGHVLVSWAQKLLACDVVRDYLALGAPWTSP